MKPHQQSKLSSHIYEDGLFHYRIIQRKSELYPYLTIDRLRSPVELPDGVITPTQANRPKMDVDLS
jgi:hypothetical protein